MAAKFPKWQDELNRFYDLDAAALQELRKKKQDLADEIQWYKNYDLFAEQKKRKELIKKKGTLFGGIFASEETIRKMKEAENKYQDFDLPKVQDELAGLHELIVRQEAEVERRDQERQRISQQLQSLIAEYARREKELENYRDEADYDPEAKKKYENAKRNIGKLNKRLLKEIHAKREDVKVIVIDGSNLCYYSPPRKPSVFVGIAPVIELAKILVGNGYGVKVIFDYSIIGRLRKKDPAVNEQTLKRAFGGGMEVIVAPSKADECVLKAAEDRSAWIVSKDQYADFPDQKAVRERRIFQPGVFEDNVVISDLDICAPYRADR